MPPTVLRDGPFGLGAVQLFVPHDPACTAFDLVESNGAVLRRIALFDLVVNNADRKAGHVFPDSEGRVWAVDHGICFHAHHKLRTVLWDFVGEPIPPEDRAALRRLEAAIDGELGGRLAGLLLPEEVEAFRRRLAATAEAGRFPPPGPGRPYPWPPV